MRYQKFYKIKQLTLYKIANISKYGDLAKLWRWKKRSTVLLKCT